MATQSKALAVVVDCSWSMSPDMPKVRAALIETKARADIAGVKMAVAAASGVGDVPIRFILPFGSSGASAAKSLAALGAPGGGTILVPAIKLAVAGLKAASVDKRILVVIWDGYASDAATIAPLVARQKGILVYQLLLDWADGATIAAKAAFGISPIPVSSAADIEAKLAEFIR